MSEWLKQGILPLTMAVALGGAVAAHAVLLYDFEESAEGWEHEHVAPVQGEVLKGRARHGSSSLAYDFSFGPKSMILHCRVKEGFPRDYSDPAFRGFSAWVYIPPGALQWEALMFARTGEDWKWSTGRTLKQLQPGWHRVQILREEIANLDHVQDIGVQVINAHAKTKARILIDQVEAIMDEAAANAGN